MTATPSVDPAAASRRRLNLGHFAAGRWQLTSPDALTDRAKVPVSGEGLQRGPVDVLGARYGVEGDFQGTAAILQRYGLRF